MYPWLSTLLLSILPLPLTQLLLPGATSYGNALPLPPLIDNERTGRQTPNTVPQLDNPHHHGSGVSLYVPKHMTSFSPFFEGLDFRDFDGDRWVLDILREGERDDRDGSGATNADGESWGGEFAVNIYGVDDEDPSLGEAGGSPLLSMIKCRVSTKPQEGQQIELTKAQSTAVKDETADLSVENETGEKPDETIRGWLALHSTAPYIRHIPMVAEKHIHRLDYKCEKLL